MTYGWALLVVLIAIAALAFFGVLNPGKFLPSNCNLGVGFSCTDYKIIGSTPIAGLGDVPVIEIVVQNGIGKTLDVFSIYISIDSNQCAGWYGYIALPNPPNANSKPFVDGSVERIRTLENAVSDPIGIYCKDVSGVLGLLPNCCNVFSMFGLTYGCDPSYTCTAQLPIPKGTKFKADLVIVYRELGSTLIHKRIGQLVAQTE